MTQTIQIKPAPGLTVRDPKTARPLATEGENKPRTTYWQRRLRDGDVVLVEDAPPKQRRAEHHAKPQAEGEE